MTTTPSSLLADVGVTHPLEDAEVWRDNHTAEPIAGMSPERRLNLALALHAQAGPLARRFERYVAWDRRPCEPIPDPQAWILATPLLRALVTGLPTKRAKLAVLDQRAAHQPTCLGHDGCGCGPRPATDRALLLALVTGGGPR
jgi:hypothetical protein